jgi:hypothetical protein
MGQLVEAAMRTASGSRPQAATMAAAVSGSTATRWGSAMRLSSTMAPSLSSTSRLSRKTLEGGRPGR